MFIELLKDVPQIGVRVIFSSLLYAPVVRTLDPRPLGRGAFTSSPESLRAEFS